MTTKKPKNNKKESKYFNATPIEKLLEDSKFELGSIDIIEPTRIFKRNWVDTVRDLRLLHKENELKTLVRINEKLLKWLSRECEKSFADDSSPDLQMFIYSYDFDKNGIVYSIGTLFGTRAWQNPGVDGIIGVHLSSIMHDSVPAHSILGRSAVRCVTKPEKNSWVIIDFSPKIIKPTHYAMRHYSTWDTEALRTWTFEGSLDGGQTWKLLSRHKNDTSLNQKGATCTWKLSDGDHGNNIENLELFYSHFRILQTDFNSNRHYYLACSGFEIYGAMKDMDDEKGGQGGGGNMNKAASGNSLTFLPSYDFDTNGIIYWLGTNRGTSPWKNPGIRGSVRIISSSLAKDSHPCYAAVGRETVRCVTEPKKSSWFMIDLLGIKVQPTHYSMRHYSSFDTECTRNWRIEGSNNSTTGYDGQWTLLLKHVNDTSLNHKGATHTWSLQQPNSNNNNASYSQYRLFQFGVNSNQHHYLPLSGFEIYGTIVDGHAAKQVGGGGLGANNSSAITVPKGQIRQFKHVSDFDTNGLLYFLGVQGGARPYSNPSDIGMCTVTSSSLMSDSQPLSSLVGRLSTRCVTKPHQRSWMQINLRDVKIKLTHYTLRHYNSWDTEALRYWNFEGSNDGQSWIPIRQHMDDRALRKAAATHTWALDTNNYFNNFRLYMTGRNSNNHWYLACSGAELYGTAFGGIVSQKYNAKILPMVPMSPIIANNNNPMQFPMPIPPNNLNIGAPQQQQQQQQNININNSNSTTFDYNRDFDNNGLCYFLGTKCGTQQWQNPAQLGILGIRTSGLMHDSTPQHCIVGRQSTRCVTKPLKHAWIIIDFNDYAIRPTRYTLRHYASWDTEALRNWRLEGSLDGETWSVIREHHNDESLRFKGQSYSWLLRNINSYYSQFRIFQFDKNSNNHYYLACSGFEIYGQVLRQNTNIQWDEWPRNKSKHLQVNRIKNSVANIGSDDTWQSVKTRQPLKYSQENINTFTILVERAQNTSNSWKFMVGIAPDEFTCNGSRQWLGSQKSYAYIGGTGGKCFDNTKSISYGSKWGAKSGDCITVISNNKKKTIEFILNNKSQGIAFNNYNQNGRNMFAAASITATGSRIRLMEIVTPRSKPPTALINNQQQPQQQGNIIPQIQPQQPQVVVPPPPQQQNNNSKVNYGWDQNLKSQHLAIFPDGITVTNKGSNDTWQGICSQMIFSSGKHSFEIHIINDVKTSNQWKYIFGVVPVSFDPKRTAWLGSQNSWGYIGGTGGKCHTVGKSVAYGKRFGGNDRIKIQIDFNKRTIEFFRNDKSQGVAFNNLNGAVRPAVSLTAKGAAVRICNIK